MSKNQENKILNEKNQSIETDVEITQIIKNNRQKHFLNSYCKYVQDRGKHKTIRRNMKDALKKKTQIKLPGTKNLTMSKMKNVWTGITIDTGTEELRQSIRQL